MSDHISIEETLKLHGIQIQPQFPTQGWLRNDSQWFGSKIIQSGGKAYKMAVFGDFRNGVRGTWSEQDAAELSAEEQDKLREQIEQMSRSEKEEREKLWEQTAHECQALWETLSPASTDNPYLVRKKILPHGIREKDGVLYIPCRDVEGKLWGLQKIFPGGDKRYTLGQKIKGLFHLLGELNKDQAIFIAEGYATAASVYAGLGGSIPVAVAFNVGNLLPVAEALLDPLRHGQILLAGDDDQWTRRPNGELFNPGRTQATAAAHHVCGRAVFPVFQSLEGRPNDFNDLQCREGIQTVTDQLMNFLQGAENNAENTQEDPRSEVRLEDFIRPLGFCDNHYFYTSSSNPQINRLKEFSETELYNLMPREYWFENYAHSVKKRGQGTVREIDWAQLKSDLMGLGRRAGYFERTRVRGQGVWSDGGKTILHLGDRLFYNDSDHSLGALEKEENSPFLYEYGKRLPPVEMNPLTDQEMAPFLKMLSLLLFRRPEQALFLGGWIALSSICGILSWRPHIWVTGEQGSGKSTAVDLFIRKFVEAFDYLHAQGATTEAGIRQSLRAKAIPVLFDEFESNTKQSADRVERVVELFRQASSDTGGSIVKGSGSGDSMEYQVRFMGCVASIGTNITTSADKSRFTLIELQKDSQDPEQWRNFLDTAAHFDTRFVSRFFARMVSLVPVILENQRRLQLAFAKIHSQRFGQQYGTLLAGWAACLHGRLLTPQELTELVSQVHLDQELSSSDIQDQEECFTYLMTTQIRLEDQTTSLEKLFQGSTGKKLDWKKLANDTWREDPDWKTLKPRLWALGLSPTLLHDEKPGVVILKSHPELKKIFKDTPWQRSWALSLSRLKGAVPNRMIRVNEGIRVRGTYIPSEYFDSVMSVIEPKF